MVYVSPVGTLFVRIVIYEQNKIFIHCICGWKYFNQPNSNKTTAISIYWPKREARRYVKVKGEHVEKVTLSQLCNQRS